MKTQSKKQRMLDAIAELGGIDVVMKRIASCESLTSIAGSLGVSRDTLGRYLNNDPRLRSAVGLARESSGKMIVEEALSIGRRATRLAEAAARLQAHGRVWLAARNHAGRSGERTRRRAVKDRAQLRRKGAGLRVSPEASAGVDHFPVTTSVARTSKHTAFNKGSEETGRN